ncbi:MAG: hypothetical protein HPY50_14435 [Firmicutes bacterium]|nr:hypothetical protein [Bacillota bacterium]
MTWKVIKIISDTQLVVNAGSKNNIKRNDELIVYDQGEELYDPDTGESLGTLDTVKCYLLVQDVFEKMCICVNKETRLNDMQKSLLALSMSLKGIDSGPIHKPLPVNAEDISGGLIPKSRIKVGDLVKKAD